MLTAVSPSTFIPAAAAKKRRMRLSKTFKMSRPKKGETSLSQFAGLQVSVYQMIDMAINVVVSPAQAAKQTWQLTVLKSGSCAPPWKAALASLQPLYAAGFIGIQSDACWQSGILKRAA